MLVGKQAKSFMNRHTEQSLSILDFSLPDIPASTTQGGGGSFEDRKPVGEMRCCGSRMAEQIH